MYSLSVLSRHRHRKRSSGAESGEDKEIFGTEILRFVFFFPHMSGEAHLGQSPAQTAAEDNVLF